ncbi:diphthamide synthesis protein [Candidatus Woesearchaeota archaeon]|nr:diphthamide synthesis protein [Candidatus Woesearchaeota archaeon]
MPMKIMMVEGRYTGPIDLSRLDTKLLPKKIGLATTVQFLNHVDEIKQFLKDSGKEVYVDRMRQKYEGQLLGCDQGGAEKIKDNVDAFLYVGTGVFHPLGIAINIDKEVFCYDPIHSTMSKVDQDQVKRYNLKRKGAYLKFLEADEIGILVSLKPGQNNFRKAVELKQQLKGKNCYIFAFDTLDFSQIENFPFIQCWVNTACNRILDDYSKFPRPLVDLSDIEKMQKVEMIPIKTK